MPRVATKRSKRYPDARERFITADAGGSNSSRSHVWKYELQQVADKLGISIPKMHARLRRRAGARPAPARRPVDLKSA